MSVFGYIALGGILVAPSVGFLMDMGIKKGWGMMYFHFIINVVTYSDNHIVSSHIRS